MKKRWSGVSPLLMLLVAVSFIVTSGCTSRSRRADGERATETVLEEDSEDESPQAEKVNYMPIDFKLYIERSGSMVPFDASGSKGEFKKTLSDFLNNIPPEAGDSSKIFIVNDNIYSYPGNISSFISDRDFFARTREYGDPSYTDFSRIFNMILAGTHQNQLSILVSDFIYSVKDQERVNPTKLLNEASSLTSDAFKGHTSQNAMIVKFEADYSGPYYPYNSPGKGMNYNGERPFYALLVGSRETFDLLMHNPAYSKFMRLSAISGYQNQFFFTSSKYTPAYTVLSSEFDKTGTYKPADRKEKLMHSIKDAEPARGKFIMPVALDLSGMPLSSFYLSDISNYEIVSGSDFEIRAIHDITPENMSAVLRKKLSGATHVIVLETDGKIQNETLEIRLRNRLPAWVKQSSTDDDTDFAAPNFSRTTFAFQQMMAGILSAYVKGDEAYFFSLPIKISK